MMFSLWLFLLASAVAPAADETPAIHTTATVDVLVTDRRGKPIPAAHVVVNELPERKGKTNSAGHVVFTNMQTGAYTLRVERDKFITFEKDFSVQQSRWIPVVAAISPVSSLKARPSRAAVSARPAAVPASSTSPRLYAEAQQTQTR